MDVKQPDLSVEYQRLFGAWLVAEVRALRARFVIATGTVPTRLFVPVDIEGDLLNACPPGLSSIDAAGNCRISEMQVIPVINISEMKVAA